MDILSQLEDLQGELEGKVLDVFSEHLKRLADFESKFMENIPEPWVYLKFEDGRIRAQVNWSDSSGDVAQWFDVEIQGLESDATPENMANAIWGAYDTSYSKSRRACAEYLRRLANMIEAGEKR